MLTALNGQKCQIRHYLDVVHTAKRKNDPQSHHSVYLGILLWKSGSQIIFPTEFQLGLYLFFVLFPLIPLQASAYLHTYVQIHYLYIANTTIWFESQLKATDSLRHIFNY